jgi:hypothetical protein
MKLLAIFLGIVLLISCVSAATQWCGIQNLYFQDNPSGVSTFRELANYANGANQTDENVTISSANGIVPIDSYLSFPGTPGGGVTLFGGLRQFNIYGWVTSISQPSYFVFNVSVYHANGTETFYYNTTSIAISSTAPALDRTFFVYDKNITFASTDRMLIRVGAYTTRNTGTTIHFLDQGTIPTYKQSGYFDCPPVAVNTAGESAGNSGIVVGGAGVALSLMAIGLARQRRKQ